MNSSTTPKNERRFSVRFVFSPRDFSSWLTFSFLSAAFLGSKCPTWILLRPVLRDHPDFQYWDENATPPAPQAANDEAADPYDPMQGALPPR